MKRKNLFFVSALILFGLANVNSVKAQNTATVNIKFKPIQTIVVNDGKKVVDFLYETPEDYQNGIDEILVTDQLTVNSSGPFIVNVQSTDFVAGLLTIPAGDMTVTAEKGTGNHRTGTTYETPSVELLTTGVTPFITSTGGGMGLNFNVKYDNTGFDETYVDKVKNAETTYIATVTYTIMSH